MVSSENTVVLFDTVSKKYLRFSSPRRVIQARAVSEVLPALREVEGETNKGYFAAGCLAYEAAPAFDAALQVHSAGDFPLLWFGIYDSAEEMALPGLNHQPDIEWVPSVAEDDYFTALARIKSYIEEGHTYQVNYSFRLQGDFHGDPWELFLRMVASQRGGYPAFVNMGNYAVCSASPELFFNLDGESIVTKPMKGTAPRGCIGADDQKFAQWLGASEKNRAENLMIVDMVRNDLGKIVAAGSLTVPALFSLEKYPTVWQMTSTVQGQTKRNLADIFQALFPSASITGAPKVRTMQIIRELESSPRRIYTGTVGYAAPGRRAQFNVAIRTVLIDKRCSRAEYGIGSGVTWDSDHQDELEECRVKAKVVANANPPFALLETLRWSKESGYYLLDEHLARLLDSADYFSRNIDVEVLRARLHVLAQKFSDNAQRVRVVVPEAGEIELMFQPLVPLPKPYRVGLAREPVSSREIFLYHKTTNRNVYERARETRPDCDDVLLWNERGELTEGTLANVAVEIDGKWLTPPISCGLLGGTERNRLLARGELFEACVRACDLSAESKIHLINSVRGRWEVKLVGAMTTVRPKINCRGGV